MDLDILGRIAEGGFGYLLFVGSVLVNITLYRQNQKLQDKRVDDLIEFRASALNTVNNLVTTVGTLQKSVDTVAELMQNMQWRKQ